MLISLSPFQDVRVPDDFESKGKPHITKADGQWWVVFPQSVPPTTAQLRDFRPFMKMLTGITPIPSPTFVRSPKALQ